MKNIDIARAWKDAEYRASLTAEELATLPENPAGAIELSESDLSMAGAVVTDGSQCVSIDCPTALPCRTDNSCSGYTYPANYACTYRKPYACWS